MHCAAFKIQGSMGIFSRLQEELPASILEVILLRIIRTTDTRFWVHAASYIATIQLSFV